MDAARTSLSAICNGSNSAHGRLLLDNSLLLSTYLELFSLILIVSSRDQYTAVLHSISSSCCDPCVSTDALVCTILLTRACLQRRITDKDSRRDLEMEVVKLLRFSQRFILSLPHISAPTLSNSSEIEELLMKLSSTGNMGNPTSLLKKPSTFKAEQLKSGTDAMTPTSNEAHVNSSNELYLKSLLALHRDLLKKPKLGTKVFLAILQTYCLISTVLEELEPSTVIDFLFDLLINLQSVLYHCQSLTQSYVVTIVPLLGALLKFILRRSNLDLLRKSASSALCANHKHAMTSAGTTAKKCVALEDSDLASTPHNQHLSAIKDNEMPPISERDMLLINGRTSDFISGHLYDIKAEFDDYIQANNVTNFTLHHIVAPDDFARDETSGKKCNICWLKCCSQLLSSIMKAISAHKDQYDHVVIHLIAEFAIAYSQQTVHADIKTALSSGIYSLFEMVDHSSLRHMNLALPVTARQVFKSLYDDFNKFSKYSGRV